MVPSKTQAAVAVRAPEWLGKLYGPCHAFFADRLAEMKNTVVQAQSDHLDQLVPLMLVTGQDIASLRRLCGRSVWRKLHHADEMTNLYRALVWHRFDGTPNWADIVQVPQYHLRSCRNAISWETAFFASQKAENLKFAQIAMLHRDLIRFGLIPKLGWSVARLKKEHAVASARARIQDASPVHWAPAWQVTRDSYHFTRLTSDQELVREGIAMRHCVASYREDAAHGTCVVMACTGAKRATFLFFQDDAYELFGFANAEISPAGHAAAQAARRHFWQEQAATGKNR